MDRSAIKHVIDVGIGSADHRHSGLPLVPAFAASATATMRRVLDWAYVEPFLGPRPRANGASQAVAHDRELEADVFEELDPQHQREFLDERSDAEIAKVLQRMAGDDAADVLVELDEDRREGPQ